MSRRAIVALDPGKVRDNAGLVVLWIDDHSELTRVVDPLAPVAVYPRPGESLRSAQRRGYAVRAGDPDAVRVAQRDAQARTPRVTRRTGDVVHAELLPLETTYPDICRAVANEMANPDLVSDDAGPFCVFDQTGVGEAVNDVANEMQIRPRRGVWLQAGERAHFERGVWFVPKGEVVTHAQIAMQRGDLKAAPGMGYGAQLMAELLNYRVTESPSGRDKYEPAADSRERRVNDDMLMALCCGWWYGSLKLALHTDTADDFPKLRR